MLSLITKLPTVIVDEHGETVFTSESLEAAIVHVIENSNGEDWEMCDGELTRLIQENVHDEYVQVGNARFVFDGGLDDVPANLVSVAPSPEAEVLKSFGKRQRRRQAERAARKAPRRRPGPGR